MDANEALQSMSLSFYVEPVNIFWAHCIICIHECNHGFPLNGHIGCLVIRHRQYEVTARW
jgi:hypothetical protein